MKTPEKALLLMLSASLFSSCQRTEGHASLYDWVKLNNSLYYNNESELDEDSLNWVKELTQHSLWQMELARQALHYPEYRLKAKIMLKQYSQMLSALEDLALENHVLLHENLSPELQLRLAKFKKTSLVSFLPNYFQEMQANHLQLIQLLQEGLRLRKTTIRNFARQYLIKLEQNPV